MKRKNPITSHDAHISMIPVIPSHHQKILDALQKHGEGIYEEIAGWCGFKNANSCSRRLKELELEPPHGKGLIEKTGATRNTSTGRKASLYRLKPDVYVINTENCSETIVTPKSAQNQVIQQSLFK